MQNQNTATKPSNANVMQIALPNGTMHNVPATPATQPTPATPTTGAGQATTQGATANALALQAAKLQAQLAALQAQQATLQNLAAGVAAGQYYITKPSNAQTNVGLQDLPKAVTLILQLLPLVTGSNALLPAQQAAITQLLLQAASQIEVQGNVPLAKQRIAQA